MATSRRRRYDPEQVPNELHPNVRFWLEEQHSLISIAINRAFDRLDALEATPVRLDDGQLFRVLDNTRLRTPGIWCVYSPDAEVTALIMADGNIAKELYRGPDCAVGASGDPNLPNRVNYWIEDNALGINNRLVDGLSFYASKFSFFTETTL